MTNISGFFRAAFCPERPCVRLSHSTLLFGEYRIMWPRSVRRTARLDMIPTQCVTVFDHGRTRNVTAVSAPFSVELIRVFHQITATDLDALDLVVDRQLDRVRRQLNGRVHLFRCRITFQSLGCVRLGVCCRGVRLGCGVVLRIRDPVFVHGLFCILFAHFQRDRVRRLFYGGVHFCGR